MFRITVESHFAAAHRIREYGGDCENIHGHNFRVLLSASFRELPSSGMCMDFRRLKEILDSVLEPLDHRDISQTEYFSSLNPTSENIAKYIYDMARDKCAPVSEVTVFETEGYSASYSECPDA